MRRDGGPDSDSGALEVLEPLSSPGKLGFISEGVLRLTRPSWAQPTPSLGSALIRVGVSIQPSGSELYRRTGDETDQTGAG